MLFGLLLISMASAQVAYPTLPVPGGPDPNEEDQDLLLGIHGVAEVWSDAAIATVYRSSVFTGALTATWQFHRFLAADIEVSYVRTPGLQGQRFEMTPIAADLSAWTKMGNVELFGGIGPALVPWSDKGTDLRSGTKIGMDTRVGLRVATAFYTPPDYPPATMERVDLEIFVGRRSHFGPTTTAVEPDVLGQGSGRLDLSAIRAGIGFKVRL